MKKDDFISSIGYDGNVAIVDRVRRKKVSGKGIDALLESSNFRSAAALAIYTDSDSDLQKVTDYYNKYANAHYTKDSIARVFGISRSAKSDSTKIVLF